jgi:Cupredoxin-like domain
MTATGPDRPDLRLGQLSPPPPPRRRPQLVVVVLLVTLLVAVAGAVLLGYEYGSSRNGNHRAAPSPSPSTATGQFSPTPASATTTMPPPRPRVLTLITKDLAYLVPGQAGTQPSFVVRPGERLRMRVDNTDAYKHSFTFAPSKVDLDAGEHTVSVTGPFRAPTNPGTYSFYCKYRYTGMDGRIIVRRS